ncbi:hypothetical protein [Spiroplasma endosymbiont of Ammophila pubescens]|uniref:hypothetical protein n=1 Tax=Spiroplasma endosymbiont of Ammophila pubescens TaxID=3066315 RepID=UPI0032B14664
MASYKHCNQCRRIYLPSDYEIKNKPLETLKKLKYMVILKWHLNLIVIVALRNIDIVA